MLLLFLNQVAPISRWKAQTRSIKPWEWYFDSMHETFARRMHWWWRYFGNRRYLHGRLHTSFYVCTKKFKHTRGMTYSHVQTLSQVQIRVDVINIHCSICSHRFDQTTSVLKNRKLIPACVSNRQSHATSRCEIMPLSTSLIKNVVYAKVELFWLVLPKNTFAMTHSANWIRSQFQTNSGKQMQSCVSFHACMCFRRSTLYSIYIYIYICISVRRIFRYFHPCKALRLARFKNGDDRKGIHPSLSVVACELYAGWVASESWLSRCCCSVISGKLLSAAPACSTWLSPSTSLSSLSSLMTVLSVSAAERSRVSPSSSPPSASSCAIEACRAPTCQAFRNDSPCEIYSKYLRE